MPIVLRALFQLLQSWRSILAFAGLIAATSFSFGNVAHQVVQSITDLWWIVALACIVIIVREYVRGYFELKKEQMRRKEQ